MKRRIALLEHVWGIGKRKFGKEWEKRIWLFDMDMMSYRNMGMEREEIEKVHDKYIKCNRSRKRYTRIYDKRRNREG